MNPLLVELKNQQQLLKTCILSYRCCCGTICWSQQQSLSINFLQNLNKKAPSEKMCCSKHFHVNKTCSCFWPKWARKSWLALFLQVYRSSIKIRTKIKENIMVQVCPLRCARDNAPGDSPSETNVKYFFLSVFSTEQAWTF